MVTQTFNINIVPKGLTPRVAVDQYDTGLRTLVAQVYEGTERLVLTDDYTYTVVGTKPSGTGFSYEASVENGDVVINVTGQMTVVAGPVLCGIIVTDGDGGRVGTHNFYLDVQPAALKSDTIIDSDDFGSIISAAVEEWMDEHGVVIDPTLTVAGAAADAKATGDAIDELKSAFDLDSLTPGVKSALLNLLEHVAYTDENGQTYYDALYDALYNRYWQVTNNLTNCTTSNASEQTLKSGTYSATITASAGYVMTGATVSITMGGNDITATAYSNGTISISAVTGALVITISAAAKTVSSISAVYTQGGTVYDTDTLDSLKNDLVVTATYTDSSTATVPAADYTLSGTLTIGTNTITVSYGNKTTTFTVSVTDYLTSISFDIYNWVRHGGTDPEAEYVRKASPAVTARAGSSTVIKNKNYTFTVTDSSKYNLVAYNVTSDVAVAWTSSGGVTYTGYPGVNNSKSWAASGSSESDFVALSFKKMDNTDFTASELANMYGAVFTVS